MRLTPAGELPETWAGIVSNQLEVLDLRGTSVGSTASWDATGQRLLPSWLTFSPK